MQDEVLAFLLVIGAGCSTGVGAAFVFSPRLIKLANRQFLAGSLGLSAGVMLYVSFVEIMIKSREAFEDEEDISDENAYLYSTLCFFFGMIIMKFLDYLVSILEPQHHHAKGQVSTSGGGSTVVVGNTLTTIGEGTPLGQETVELHNACSCDVSPATIDEWQRRASEEIEHDEAVADAAAALAADRTPNTSSIEISNGSLAAQTTPNQADLNASLAAKKNDLIKQGLTPADADKKLVRMGINTALAIGIHNFPEGLATFVATVADPTVGISLAVAIAIHNVPEGLCVSIPIYYATGDKKKAFLWACLSGLTEPIGALFGWVLLSGAMGNVMYGLMFGIVGGMMTMICLHELLPTAYRYDPDDEVVTNSVIAGMMVMALSLVLFVVG